MFEVYKVTPNGKELVLTTTMVSEAVQVARITWINAEWDTLQVICVDSSLNWKFWVKPEKPLAVTSLVVGEDLEW